MEEDAARGEGESDLEESVDSMELDDPSVGQYLTGPRKDLLESIAHEDARTLLRWQCKT